MRKSLLASAALVMTTAASMASAAYLPTGPQLNVALSTVTSGGWTLCYSATLATPFGNDASALSGCTGSRLMLAGRETGSDTLLVLAQTTKTDALFDTGQNNTQVHLSDGSDWYYHPQWSWGFAPGGAGVFKSECDVLSGSGRICIHTFNWVGGYRINDNYSNSATNFEKLVFTNSSPAPEPASWALMLGGFGAIGGALRARRKAAVSFA